MRSIEQKRRIKLFAAFGSLQDDPLRLNQSYQDARRVAELSLVLPAGSVMEYRKQYFDDESELVPRIDFEKLEAAGLGGHSKSAACPKLRCGNDVPSDRAALGYAQRGGG